jgi:hypothetical protein
LERGGTLTVVMLGDSIVNDTSRSCWNLLLERIYPAVEIEKVTCVRGSTGCWWYREPGRVKAYVLDDGPDLVIIGGISQRGDLASIRDVLRQIRADRGLRPRRSSRRDAARCSRRPKSGGSMTRFLDTVYPAGAGPAERLRGLARHLGRR